MTFHGVMRRGLFFSVIRSGLMQQSAASSHEAHISPPEMNLQKIGKREVVGYGLNGEPTYFDKMDYPMPAIRFKEVTPDIQALKEKEKGDWKKLTLEEKKALYRASFCQTFSEIKAPTGEWKLIIGMTLIGISFAFWIFILMKLYVYPPMPSSFSPEAQKAQLKRMIDLRVNPIDGIGSKWDYEKGTWKK